VRDDVGAPQPQPARPAVRLARQPGDDRRRRRTSWSDWSAICARKVCRWSVAVRDGEPAQEIVAFGKSIQADCIIIGRHDHAGAGDASEPRHDLRPAGSSLHGGRRAVACLHPPWSSPWPRSIQTRVGGSLPGDWGCRQKANRLWRFCHQARMPHTQLRRRTAASPKLRAGLPKRRKHPGWLFAAQRQEFAHGGGDGNAAGQNLPFPLGPPRRHLGSLKKAAA